MVFEETYIAHPNILFSGQKFAMMELKALIGRILYDFYLEPIDRISDMKIMADIVIRPQKPIRLKFIKIKKES